MSNVFVEVSLLFILVFLVATVMKLLKQPLIIGYIIAGILISPSITGLVGSTETISIFSQIGVAFLLFIVGLHLNPKVIKEVGLASLVSGLGQVLFTALGGFGLMYYLLNFNFITSIYVSIAITFSSTIIIMKLLSDRGLLETLVGKLSVGFLLVQDLVAIIALMVIAAYSNGTSDVIVINTLFKGIGILALVGLVSYYILPLFQDKIARSQEYLFLFSLAWMFALSALFEHFHFSIEIGALLAGVTLSMSRYHFEITAKIKPLRDFFLVLFFIYLGTLMTFENITSVIIPIIVLTLWILIGNPLIMLILMGFMGYTKKTSFFMSLSAAQISEFSLILLALGAELGHISGEILSIVTVVGLLTIAASTYGVLYMDFLYKKCKPLLKFFVRHPKKIHEHHEESHELYLFGYGRVGQNFIDAFRKMKHSYLIVDYDPETIISLTQQGYECKYGDTSEIEFLNDFDFKKAKLIVSTISDPDTNILLINHVRRENKNTIIIVLAKEIEDALVLYNAGATYVLTPHMIGGEYLTTLIDNYGLDIEKFLEEKVKHVDRLIKKRKK